MKQPAAEPKTPEVLMEDLREIIASNVAGNVQLLTRVGSLLGNSARAATTMPPRAPDASRLVAQGLEAAIASSAIINAHSLAMLNELVAIAERTLATAVEERPPGAATPTVDAPSDVDLEGRVGQVVTGQFAVDNEYDSPVQVSFTVGAPAANTQALPLEYVTLSPRRAVIPAKGSTSVLVTVDVGEKLIVGRTYAASIRVVGFEAPEVRLRLTVLGASDSALLNTKAAKRSKRRGGKSR
jgi:hypothetical protein